MNLPVALVAVGRLRLGLHVKKERMKKQRNMSTSFRHFAMQTLIWITADTHTWKSAKRSLPLILKG